MKNDQNIKFTVDKENKTVLVSKTFAADIAIVWDAFTKQEILDEWWAPKPWLSKTKVMDFKVGGRRFYAMVGPEGEEHWSVQQFKSITPKSNFKMLDAFSDKDENLVLPGSDWDLNFTSKNGNTQVDITIYNESAESLQEMLDMGFKEGFTMTLNYLDELLLTSTK